jgi:hypothetical protein
VFAGNSANSKQVKALKTSILTLKAELAATSSQDQFAKWAKLRRKSDKAVADLEALSSFCHVSLFHHTDETIATTDVSSASTKSSFSTKFKGALWLFTTALPFIISSWYRKEAVFYLPANWFGPLTWFIGLPSAPTGKLISLKFSQSTAQSSGNITGAIACGIWTMVCKRFIGAVKSIILDLLEKEEAKKAPMATEKTEKVKPVPIEVKKEL